MRDADRRTQLVTKRHAKPTALQLINRLYRQSLANTRDVGNQLAIIRLDLQESRLRAKTVKTLIDHCARLLREKETLQRKLYAVKEMKDRWPLPWPENVRPPSLAMLRCNCGASAYSQHAVIPWHHSNDCPEYRPEPLV
jgi:hypothetical protein